MKLIDSCGWLEFFTGGPQAAAYGKELAADMKEILVPAIVLYEVYKFLLRTSSEETAIRCTAHMTQCRVIDLDSVLALESAEISLSTGLAMADAIVYATSRKYSAQLITSDADLKDMEGVIFLEK
ncbi:MAG: type II toxin-antitoxin system VapC family toxin [bacterium]|nr:type II toxin-antitoxin system VapC family toxin [bacterium]MDT8395268.1 type II toxin-antitoxin system VapC family toxin [bacterium]